MRKKDNEKQIAINQAVLDLIVDDGYQNLSMSKVAKKAGVSPATIYLFYPDKEGMLTAIYVEAKSILEDQMKVEVTPQTDVEMEFKKLFTGYIRALMAHPKQGIFLNIVNQNPQLIDAQVHQELMEKDQGLQALLDFGQATNRVKRVDYLLLIGFTFYALNNVLEISFNSGTELSETQIEDAVTMCWQAIRA